MRPASLKYGSDGPGKWEKGLGELRKALLTVVPLQIIHYSKTFHMDTLQVSSWLGPCYNKWEKMASRGLLPSTAAS